MKKSLRKYSFATCLLFFLFFSLGNQNTLAQHANMVEENLAEISILCSTADFTITIGEEISISYTVRVLSCENGFWDAVIL
jgi:hypothetical protein